MKDRISGGYRSTRTSPVTSVPARGSGGQDDADLFTPELAAKYHSDDVRIMETGEAEEFEEKYIVAGKNLGQHNQTPIRGEKGEIEGVLGVFWDITGRKQAESELRRYVNQLS